VKAFDIERWKTARSKEVAKSTVNGELNVIRGCFSRAVEWGQLVSSSLTTVKPYRVDNTRTRNPLHKEIRLVIARTTLERLPRLSEVLSLRREDIGPEWATIVQSKNGKSRRVPLTADLRDALLQRAHASGFIFGKGRTGSHRARRQHRTPSAGSLAGLNLKDVSHHVLRHTGAMLAAGISIRTVQEIGGWTSLRMLERYTHPTEDEKQKAVRVLADVTGAKTGASADRAISAGEPEERQRVVGLDDWRIVPNGTGDLA
jgi:integrase